MFRKYGLVPAIVTPMDSKFEVDLDQIENYIKWILKYDVAGLAVNVDTGEGPSLTPEEKIKILETVSSTVKGKVPIIAGLQAINTMSAVKRAIEAKNAGANALLVFPHSAFIGEPNADVVYEYYREVYEKAQIPLVAFQLQPALGGVLFSKETLMKLAELEGVIAIKEASFDAKKFIDTVRILRKAKRKIFIFTGNDNFIYESLVLGADGGLLGFGTIAVDKQVEMFRLVGEKKYEEAEEIWEELLPLVEVIFASPVRNYKTRIKEALVMMGVLETAYVRPPLRPISSEEKEKLRKVLKDLGML